MKHTKRVILLILVLLFSMSVFASVSPEIIGEATIRIQDPMGLRIKATIDCEKAYDEYTYEYGFLVTRKVFLTGNGYTCNDLTFDCDIYFDKGVAKGVVDGKDIDKFYDKTDTELYFAGHFYGISSQYYTDVIVARPYIISEEGTFYGVPFETSIYETAKRIYNNQEIYNSLSDAEKNEILSIIVAVDGEPYELAHEDLRIVLDTRVIKNSNPTFSVCYDLFNPYTGETTLSVMGRKRSKDKSEISSMLIEAGSVVPMHDGIVQDTTEGYIVTKLNFDNALWVSEISTAAPESVKISFVPTDSSFKCKDCTDDYIKQETGGFTDIFGTFHASNTAFTTTDVPVSVIENGTFSTADIFDIENASDNVLCYNVFDGKKVYSDYVKALPYVDDDGICRFILVIVCSDDNAALDEKCLEHTYFDVNFIADGKRYETESVKYGEVPLLPKAPVKEGYNFLGWSDAEGGEVAELGAVTGEKTYYAVFKEIPKYTVTFYVDDEIYNEQTITEGEFATLPKAPEKEGCIFTGWSGDVQATPVVSDTEYYAVFKGIPKYTVTFYVDDEIYNEQTITEGEFATLPKAPEKEGCIFMGWSGDVQATPVVSDTEYHAVFKGIPKYTVTFYVDGAVYDEQTVTNGGVATLPEAPSVAVGIFEGWSLEENSDTVENVSEIIINGDTKFYAVILLTNPNSDEFLENLSEGYSQLSAIKRVTGNAKSALTIIKECISLVLIDANNYIYIDKNYVTRVYGTKISEVKVIVDEDMTKSERSQFVNLITSSVDETVQEFLKSYFGISMEVV